MWKINQFYNIFFYSTSSFRVFCDIFYKNFFELPKKKKILSRGRIIDFFHRFNSKKKIKVFKSFRKKVRGINPISMTLQSFIGEEK